MQIINTTSGPAILTDQSDVVLPGDLEDVAKMVESQPKVVSDLVESLIAKVEASLPVIAKLKALEVLDDEDEAILHMGQICHMNIENVSRALRLERQSHDHGDPQEETK